ncbi:MAG: N-6 DNA methylase [Alphaproteobacteria bacterium]|nr:N-6 DNA methylase [Alphaproteobacteria bacterium]
MALLVALRWADTQDAEQAAVAEFNGEEPSCILPPGLRWAAWREAPRPLDAGEVTALWNGIRDVLGLPPDARGIHDELTLPEGKLLGHMVAWVDGLALDTPSGRRASGEAFTDLVLRSIDQTRFGGELMTPRTAGRLMVAFADPRPGERIYDPCLGTGGLLVEAADALWTRGREVPAGEWARAQQVPIFGIELHSELHLVAFVRLLLAGVRPALELGDALEREAAGRHQDQGFDCVLADPPWGAKVEGAHLYDFPIRGRTSENLFFQHAVRSLRPGGRAVVAVPPGLLWRDGADRELREWLLGEYRVEAVLNFQGPAFRGLRSVPPALVLVRRAPPGESVAFVDLIALPDTVTGCRNLARAVLSGDTDAVAPHALRHVPVSELLKADAKLVVPPEIEAESDADLAELARLVDLVPLSEVASVAAGVSISRAAVVDVPVEGALPIVRVSEIGEGRLRLGERYLRPEHVAKARDDQFARQGTVLLSVDGTIGKVQYVHSVLYTDRDAYQTKKDDRLAVAQKGLVVLRAKRLLDPRFLAAVLASDTYQALLRRLARGATIAHLSLRELRHVRVPVPAPAVQERVLRRLGEQPGDALELLALVLAGDDDDPLASLFREHPAFAELVADAMPEGKERTRAALAVLRELQVLRNLAVHGQKQVAGSWLPWLMALGAAPVGALSVETGRQRAEALAATSALAASAVHSAPAAGELAGRTAARLAEAIAAWADEERAALPDDAPDALTALIDNTSTRLPLVFCLDTSGSMEGERIGRLNASLNSFLADLHGEGGLREACEVGVVTFSAGVRRVLELGPVGEGARVQLRAGGMTDLGAGVSASIEMIELRRREYAAAGRDHHPAVLVLLTDGLPTDVTDAAAERARLMGRDLLVLPVGVGDDAGVDVLATFSREMAAFRLRDLSFERMFEWLRGKVAETVAKTADVMDFFRGVEVWGERWVPAGEGSSDEVADLGVSPYITGDVVDDPEMFKGREAVLNDIRTHLGGGTKVILLEGNRRTGKTSILRQLKRPELGLLDVWLPVESSFQGTAGDRATDGVSTEGVFRMLVRDVAHATKRAGMPVALPDVEESPSIATSPRKFALALTAYFDGMDPYEGLLIYVDAVTDAIAPRRLLLMLDEFDKLQVGIDNGVTSPQVPENIRNLLQTRRSVAAIITGSRRLKRLREEYWSALFGFGHRIGIDPLSDAEVAELVRDPVAGRLSFSDGAVSSIAANTAGQPYLVQSLCARIFELAKRKNWRRIGTEEVEQAAERTVRDNEHFQALWSYAENERRRLLLWLCHELADGPHRVNAALLGQRLERSGVPVPVEVVDDDLKFLRELELVALSETPLGPQYQLAIPLMRRWMESNVDPEAQRRRAVREHATPGDGHGSGSGAGYGYGYPDGSRNGSGLGDGYGFGLPDGSGYGSDAADDRADFGDRETSSSSAKRGG